MKSRRNEKEVKRFLSVLFVVSVLFVLSVPSFANVFNLGPGLTNLETVTVGDPGNPGELSGAGAGGYGPDRICGSVSYIYNIGKYEVTAAQYCDFLNHVAKTDTYGLYSYRMSDLGQWEWGCNIQRSGSPGSYTYSVSPGWANRPVNHVTFWNSLRFANWLHNGQPTGLQNLLTTEDGAYFINGYTGNYGQTIQRKTGWQWAVTSEDEWYKAAYYKAGGTNAGYWDYPMQGELPAVPSNDVTNPDDGNNANFYLGDYSVGSPYYRTVVGEFENSESAYGTFDQGGNVSEWNEGLVYPSGNRGLRGGSFIGSIGYLFAQYRNSIYPLSSDYQYGFRVVQAVPEPSSLMILAGGIGMILGIRRRNG